MKRFAAIECRPRMNTIEAHYATHLGPIYAWMMGNSEAALKRSSAELEEMGLPFPLASSQVSTALDLGAGLGLHSVALAKRGFKVTAIDSCRVLLDEIRARAAGLPIAVIEADIREFPTHVSSQCDVIVCLGDTITHLPTIDAVDSLLCKVAAALSPGGMFAATFRDYASTTLEGDERFVLVKRDENNILTCFLEYGADHVIVHDIVTQREDERWVRRTSSYSKLRLAPGWVLRKLQVLGLTARQETAPSGMIRIVARKVPRLD
jgi:2-polyprenyl-3-methyl-5-hydroxy-6-metoxy-1,4-benzoquinol methylase